MSDFGSVTNYGSSGSGDENLNQPFGFDFNDNHIFIADKANHRILKWWLSGGSFVSKLGGTAGDGDNEFNSPRDILRINNLLFIVDTGNHRIKIHHAQDLSFIKKFGSQGSGNSDFNTPKSIATDGRFLYISDSINQRIIKRKIEDLSYTAKVSIGGTLGQVWYDKHTHTVLVVDITNKAIKIYDADSFNLIDSIVEVDSVDSTFTDLKGVCVNNHYIYVLEKNRIQVFDEAVLAYKDSAGTNGSGDSNIAGGVFVKPYKNALIFSDYINHRINFWYNYEPRRAMTPSSDVVIGSKQFQQPFIVAGDEIIAGATSQSSPTNRWIEEEESIEHVAWDKE